MSVSRRSFIAGCVTLLLLSCNVVAEATSPTDDFILMHLSKTSLLNSAKLNATRRPDGLIGIGTYDVGDGTVWIKVYRRILEDGKVIPAVPSADYVFASGYVFDVKAKRMLKARFVKPEPGVDYDNPYDYLIGLVPEAAKRVPMTVMTNREFANSLFPGDAQ